MGGDGKVKAKLYYRVAGETKNDSYWLNTNTMKWEKNPNMAKGNYSSQQYCKTKKAAFRSGNALIKLGAIVTIEQCRGKRLLKIWDSKILLDFNK